MAKHLTVPELNIEVENLKESIVAKGDFDEFVKEQRLQHGHLNEKLDKLAPLESLIPFLQEMVKNQEALQRGAKWISKTIAFVAAVLGVIYLLYRMIRGV